MQGDQHDQQSDCQQERPVARQRDGGHPNHLRHQDEQSHRANLGDERQAFSAYLQPAECAEGKNRLQAQGHQQENNQERRQVIRFFCAGTLANIENSNGNKTKAEQLYLFANRLVNDQPFVWEPYALMEKENEYDMGIDRIYKAVYLDPFNAVLWQRLIRVLAKSKKTSECCQAIDKFVLRCKRMDDSADSKLVMTKMFGQHNSLQELIDELVHFKQTIERS